MTAEERFAKRFGRLQRELEQAVVTFYQDVGELPNPVPPDQRAFWMDDRRALLVLTICGPESPLPSRLPQEGVVLVPTTPWQHLKKCRGLGWLRQLFPVRHRVYQLVNITVSHAALAGEWRGDLDVEKWTRYLEEHP